MSAELYDELDFLYRQVWGTSLHHGLWKSGKESPAQARAQLTQSALKLLNPSGIIADIGCGYGNLAHQIVGTHPCEVHAITNSRVQAEAIPSHQRITSHHGDWLDLPFANESLDQAIALESLSHFSDFDQFANKVARSLRPNGSLVISDWFGSGRKSHLLDHLAQAGQIPSWRPKADFIQAAANHGLTLDSSEDLSIQVARTWSAIFKKALCLPLKQPASLPSLLRQSWRRPELLWTFPLLRLAYHQGLLEYHLLRFIKSPELSSRPSS